MLTDHFLIILTTDSIGAVIFRICSTRRSRAGVFQRLAHVDHRFGGGCKAPFGNTTGHGSVGQGQSGKTPFTGLEDSLHQGADGEGLVVKPENVTLLVHDHGKQVIIGACSVAEPTSQQTVSETRIFLVRPWGQVEEPPCTSGVNIDQNFKTAGGSEDVVFKIHDPVADLGEGLNLGISQSSINPTLRGGIDDLVEQFTVFIKNFPNGWGICSVQCINQLLGNRVGNLFTCSGGKTGNGVCRIVLIALILSLLAGNVCDTLVEPRIIIVFLAFASSDQLIRFRLELLERGIL